MANVDKIARTLAANITNISSKTDVTFSCPPRPTPIFEGETLYGDRFGNEDYTGANFRGATLEFVSFTGTNLTGADFTGATIFNCEFRDVDLTDADFSGVVGEFITSDFYRSNLTRANLSGRSIRGIINDDVIMNNAICIGTVFDLRSNLNNKDKRGIIFTKEDLAKNFVNKKMKSKELRNGYLIIYHFLNKLLR